MKPILTIFAAALVFFSCESDSDTSVNTLGSAVRFSLAEYLDAQEHSLTLKFLTTKDFPCINYQIAQRQERVGNQIVVSLEEIQKADVCLDASGPATAFVDLGHLAEGDYELILHIGQDITNQGQLSVTEQAYTLEMAPSEALVMEGNILRRIPDRVIWGTVRYDDARQADALYETLMASLRGIGAAEKRLPEGSYYYFEVDATGKLRLGEAGHEQQNTFVLEFAGSSEQLQTVLQQVAQQYGEQAMVRIYNTSGEEFTSAY